MSTTDDGPEDTAALIRDYGVTRRGFRRPGIDVLYEVAVREAEQRLGRELVAPTSTELQYVEMLVVWGATYFETLEALYYAGYYGHAVGEQLDAVLELVGFERLHRRGATGEVDFSATTEGGNAEDTTIDAGTRVATGSNESTPAIIFVVTEPTTLPAGQESVTAPIKAADPLDPRFDLTDAQTGVETNVEAGAITRLLDTINGVGDVTNPLPTGGSGERSDGSLYDFVTGRDRETDPEYRRRYENSLGIGGRATIDAIEAEIRRAGDGGVVESVEVNEELPITQNSDDTYSGRQIEPVVAFRENTAANRAAVAQAIYDSRAAGIESVGSVNVAATQDRGSEYATGLGFTVATEVPVHVEAEIVILDSFPGDGVERIKAKIVETVGGTAPGGQYVLGSGIGEDVYYHQLVGDVMDDAILGVLDYTSLTVGTNPNPTATSNVVIGRDQRARTNADRITITTTRGTIE